MKIKSADYPFEIGDKVSLKAESKQWWYDRGYKENVIVSTVIANGLVSPPFMIDKTNCWAQVIQPEDMELYKHYMKGYILYRAADDSYLSQGKGIYGRKYVPWGKNVSVWTTKAGAKLAQNYHGGEIKEVSIFIEPNNV